VATNPLSNRKPGALSRNYGSKPEVVLAAILDPKSVKSRESAYKRQRNVEIAVPRARALSDVEFGVPVPNGK